MPEDVKCEKVDRELALALEDVKRGRVTGPFRTAKALTRSLRRRA